MDKILSVTNTIPKPLLFTAGLVTTVALTIIQQQWQYSIKTRSQNPKIIPSPLKTLLPTLTEEEKSELPYPPDVFPGARDVESPYGTLRVYEWGPEEGRKVLLVHGVTVPSIVLYGLAKALVEKGGCRVMILDLWGRGYSDLPTDLHQDTGLFATQLLIALTSSPLPQPWTRIHLIGYSMGGGVAASFTAYFPHLIGSVTLLGPVGLIRSQHIRRSRRLPQFADYYPDWAIKWCGEQFAYSLREEGYWPPLGVEGRPDITERSVIAWLTSTHAGFTKAWTDSMFQAPAWGPEARKDWVKLGQVMSSRQKKSRTDDTDGKKTYDKVLVILGAKDTTVIKEEFVEDALEVLGGEQNVEIRVVDGGHEFAITMVEETLDIIMRFW